MMKQRTEWLIVVPVAAAILALGIFMGMTADKHNKAFTTVCEAKGGVVIFAAAPMCLRKQAIIEIEK